MCRRIWATVRSGRGIRLELQPYFEFVESIGIARKDIAHLWSFEITDAPEILMDKTMGKMPLPSDFLRNPFTRKIELPIRETDTPFEADNKTVINTYDGFGLSANLFFETSMITFFKFMFIYI